MSYNGNGEKLSRGENMKDKHNKQTSNSRVNRNRSKQQKNVSDKNSNSKFRPLKRSDRIEYERSHESPFYKKIMNLFLKNKKDQFQKEQSVVEKEQIKRRSDKNKEKSKQINKSFSSFKKITVSVGIVFVLALIAYTTILYGGKLLVNEEQLTITPPTTIETEDGEILWYLYDQFRLPVKLEQIPEHVQDAFIAIEDRRFYSHSGVDFRSILRAIYRDIITRSKAEGASTLTQQLAKNLFLTNDKSWLRKTKEVMIALYLEREYTKDEILEMYLNVVYFGNGQYGVEAAANKFFYKSVEDLSVAEGALLAGVVKAPNSYSPIDYPEKAKERRNLVIDSMEENDYITKEVANQVQQSNIELNISERKQNVAYHSFVDLAIKEAAEKHNISLEDLRTKRYRIVTSLRPEFQEIAYEYFQYDGYFPGNKENVEGAFVMMDQNKGNIVAAIGGRSFRIGDLNRVNVQRQPGSAMKPLAVFAPALMTEDFDPYSMLPDEKQEWDGHVVHNYDDLYEGSISFYDALKKSKNTSSVWLLNEIGIDFSKSYLNKLDMPIEDDGLSIALGGLEKGVSPIQLVQGYRTFIHSGQMVEAHAISEIYNFKGELIAQSNPKKAEVFTPQVAWTMTEMLKGVVENGTGQSGDYPNELAGKTGTTEHPNAKGNAKDVWFVGYTPEYVSALWMGYDHSDESHYLTGGSSYPTILTKNILSEINKHTELVANFTKPEGVQALAEPIEIPQMNDVQGSYIFGGLKLLKGQLSWSATKDKRIIYRIYEHKDGESELIGEVTGEDTFIIENISLFKQASYSVVPYNPLTKLEGKHSNVVELTF